MEYLDLPDPNNSFYNDQLRYQLADGIVFVFGSNEYGRHGKGAAFEAMTEYGAIYGIGEGLQNHCYAIPTKNGHLKPLPLPLIHQFVERFIAFTIQHPELYWYITPIGTGLAGHKHEDIAPMFKGVHNSWLPECWRPYL